MQKHRQLYQLKELIKSLKEQGAVDDDTSSVLAKELKGLEHAVAVKNHKQVLNSVASICKILLDLAR